MAKKCSFKKCNRSHYGRGYCQTHYVQWYTSKKVKPIKESFECIVENCKVKHSSNGKHVFKSKEEAKNFKKIYDKAYRDLNKERVSLVKKLAYEKNKPHYLKKSKEQKESLSPEVKKQYAENYKKSPNYKEVNIRGAHRRRARKMKNGFEAYTTAQVLECWGERCHICGKEIDMKAPRSPRYPGWEMGLNLDHVIPISSGGADKLENVKPAHAICNVKKGSKI